MIGLIFPTIAFFLLALAMSIEAARQTRKYNDAEARRVLAMKRLEDARRELARMERERDMLAKENASLDEDNACMAQQNADLAAERDSLMKAYGEMLNDLHDATSLSPKPKTRAVRVKKVEKQS